MISVERVVKTTPQRVWDVLADGWLYPLWVVGASRMREVDDSWPAVGSKLHHSVGVWPALLDDNTEVTDSEPLRMLALRARAWPFGEAAVRLRLNEYGGGTRVVIEEDAVSGPGKLVPKPARAPGSEVAQRRDPASPGLHRRAQAVTGSCKRAPGSSGPVTSSYDAVVIGAGPNGLVAANHLADAGWSVLVLEGQPEIGGAVRSANDVHPEFVHDTFSAFYPWLLPRRRSSRSTSRTTAWSGATPPPYSAIPCPTASGHCSTATVSSRPRGSRNSSRRRRGMARPLP